MRGGARSHGHEPGEAICTSMPDAFIAPESERLYGDGFGFGDLGAPDRYVWGGYVGGHCGVTAVGSALLCRDMRHAYGVPRCAPRQTCLVGAASSLRGRYLARYGVNGVEVNCEWSLELLISISIGRC